MERARNQKREVPAITSPADGVKKRAASEMTKSEKETLLADLRKALWRDLEGRQLEAGKTRGTVARLHYLRRFGVWNLVGAGVIFDEIDAEVKRRTDAERPSQQQAKKWLHDRYQDQSLNIGRGNKILRRQFCEAFNLEHYRFEDSYPELENLLCEWDVELASKGYTHNPVSYRHQKVIASQGTRRPLSYFVCHRTETVTAPKTKLKNLLRKDYENGCLVLSRPGVVSRKHYADLLGVKPSSLIHHIPILEYYGALVGGERMPFEDQIDAMEVWLRQQLMDGTIRIIGKLFERGPFLHHFGMKIRDGYRNSLILAMWKRVENDIANGNIKSKDDLEQLAKVRQALALAPLNPDGLKINKPFVTRQSGVPDWKLRKSEFANAVRDEEKKRFSEMLRDPLRTFLFGKVYDFRPLLQFRWKKEVVKAVVSAFTDSSAGRDSDYLKELKGNIVGFLSALAVGSSPFAEQSFAAINARQDFPHAVWSAFLTELNRKYNQEFANKNTNDAYLRGINVVLSVLGAAGVLPKTNFTLRAQKSVGGHISNFAEITPTESRVSREPLVSESTTEQEAIYEEHIKFAKWRMLQSIKPGDPVAELEDEAFFASLRYELRKAGVAIPNDPVEALSQLIAVRIERLKGPLTSIVKRWREHYDAGQALLAKAALPVGYLKNIEPETDTGRRRPFLRSLFPDERNSIQGTANFLRYTVDQHHGVMPGITDAHLGASFYRNVCRTYGGLDNLQAYLIPHRSAVAASICLYLLESGANVAVGRTLNQQAIEGSDEPGFVKVTGEKARAHGKPIVIDLPENSIAVDAMRWLANSLLLGREAASEEVANLLFVRRCGDEIVEVTGRWLWAWFKTFLSSNDDLADLPISVNMIRPSVMLLHALRNDGVQRTGKAFGQHDENVAGIYQSRTSTKYLYERKLREFHDKVETITIHTGKAARGLLGIDDATNERRISELKRTGLGGYCMVGGCEAMRCHSCPKLAIIAFPEDISDLQLWGESLKEAEGEWTRDRPERWAAEWLEWHCFTDVLEEKLQEGKAFRLIWRKATKISEMRKAQPNFKPPRPY